METELWPNLLAACRRRGVPVILANARLSERSARRYARLPALSALTMGAERDRRADRGRRRPAVGARRPPGDGHGQHQVRHLAPREHGGPRQPLPRRIGSRQVLLAASTRDGEEALLLDAFARLAPPEILLALVPRHPQRFDEVARLAAARGLTLQRRSEDQPVAAQTRVWLGDSMGEMFAYYASADVALIGGSWLPFGGQNLIEACAVGTPVVVGPHTFNFAAVAEQAIATGAALQSRDGRCGRERRPGPAERSASPWRHGRGRFALCRGRPRRHRAYAGTAGRRRAQGASSALISRTSSSPSVPAAAFRRSWASRVS